MEKILSVCLSVHVCMPIYIDLTQLVLTPIATLYKNGFTCRVQKSSRAFLRQTWARFARPNVVHFSSIIVSNFWGGNIFVYFIGEAEDTNFLPTNILCLMPRPSIESHVPRKFYHKLLKILPPPPSGNYTTLQILLLKKANLLIVEQFL